MRLQGVVRNVVAFGAFVDVGVGHDGLLHARASVRAVSRTAWIKGVVMLTSSPMLMAGVAFEIVCIPCNAEQETRIPRQKNRICLLTPAPRYQSFRWGKLRPKSL